MQSFNGSYKPARVPDVNNRPVWVNRCGRYMYYWSVLCPPPLSAPLLA